MPDNNHLRRTIGVVSFLETAVVGSGWFRLMKDGSNKDTLLWPGSSPEPSFYTRTYRMFLDGQFVNTWFKFVYNKRDNWADFEMSQRDPFNHIPTVREDTMRRMAQSMINSAATLDNTHPVDPDVDLKPKTRVV